MNSLYSPIEKKCITNDPLCPGWDYSGLNTDTKAKQSLEPNVALVFDSMADLPIKWIVQQGLV